MLPEMTGTFHLLIKQLKQSDVEYGMRTLETFVVIKPVPYVRSMKPDWISSHTRAERCFTSHHISEPYKEGSLLGWLLLESVIAT